VSDIKHKDAAASRTSDAGEIGEAIDLVKAYVKQETIGPLAGLGRKIGIGLAGALALGIGVFFLSLGLLRLIQTHQPRIASGALSWISYLIVIAFAGVVSALALARIKKIEKELN
jgi:hypothetical protein